MKTVLAGVPITAAPRGISKRTDLERLVAHRPHMVAAFDDPAPERQAQPPQAPAQSPRCRPRLPEPATSMGVRDACRLLACQRLARAPGASRRARLRSDFRVLGEDSEHAAAAGGSHRWSEGCFQRLGHAPRPSRVPRSASAPSPPRIAERTRSACANARNAVIRAPRSSPSRRPERGTEVVQQRAHVLSHEVSAIFPPGRRALPIAPWPRLSSAITRRPGLSVPTQPGWSRVPPLWSTRSRG